MEQNIHCPPSPVEVVDTDNPRVELTYHRMYTPPHRFDIKVGSMHVGMLRILQYYGEKGSYAGVAPTISWALDKHFTPDEVAFITKSINDEATLRNVTLRMTS